MRASCISTEVLFDVAVQAFLMELVVAIHFGWRLTERLQAYLAITGLAGLFLFRKGAHSNIISRSSGS